MTLENKELLLKDLSARLLYGVKCKYYDCCEDDYIEGTIRGFERQEYIQIDGVCIYIENVKTYLRPMSSMTEEEMDQLAEFHIWNDGEKIFPDCNCKLSDMVSAMNWLNKKMFDYRGLIEKGLAIEVTEENNPYKN